MTEKISLSIPRLQYKDSYIAALREFEREGQRPPWHYTMLQHNFGEYIETILSAAEEPLSGYVPQTTYWLIVDGAFAGRLDIRHHLNPKLRLFGGHIGYQIRPSMRRKGYGTLQLKLALPIVWEMGIERVLITCDDDNIGSQKIIENNGGVLEDKVDNGRASLTRRYWIEKPE